MIKIRGVVKQYVESNRPSLSVPSLDIEQGEFVFLVGPSGSGKTTFIRLLIRELLPNQGDIYIGGTNIVKLKSNKIPQLRRNVGCIFQDFKLLPNKTAHENVAFALEVIGKPMRYIKQQVPEILRLVGLEGSFGKYPDQLSGGEQQRVSIARAFVNRPPILLADEPTGNLDPTTSLGIMSLLDRINRTGTTVIMASHDREMVNSMRKRVLALEDGKIVRDQVRGVYGVER